MATAGSKKSKTAKSERRKYVRSVRFDFDRHGLRSAFVPVQEASTKDASDLIAAAIRQSWTGEDEDEDE